MARRLANVSPGRIVLGIWLILHGLLPFLNLGVPAEFMGLLAIIAGVLLIAGR